MSAPTISLSHDGSTWVDISAYLNGEVTCQSGLSTPLGEWVPGTMSFGLLSGSRAVDPMNDAATFQPRAGDWVRWVESGTDVWYGWVDKAPSTYSVIGSNVVVSSSVSCSDALARVSRAQKTAIITNGYSVVADVLAENGIDYSGSTSIATGVVFQEIPIEASATGALGVIQKATLTEGGFSALFSSRAGALTWLNRRARPTTVAVFSPSGIPMVEWKPDATDDQWYNRVTITPDEHIDYHTSTTSRSIGTGSKQFTLDAGPFTFGIGATAHCFAFLGSGDDTMDGTVTAFDVGTLSVTIDVTATTGSGTYTAWTVDMTEPAEPQEAYDQQSFDRYEQWRTLPLSTYHCTRAEAAAEATIRAASKAHPTQRVTSITIDKKTCTSGQWTTVLGLEIGDAADVSLTFGTGSPSTLRQMRQIVGRKHRRSGTEHYVTFTLGPEVFATWTAVLKQAGSTVTSSAGSPTTALWKLDEAGWCEAEIHLTASAAGTNNTEIKVTPTGLPTPLVPGNLSMGNFAYNDNGTIYEGTCTFDGTDIKLGVHNATAASPQLGQTPTFAIASPDTLSLFLNYPTV